MKATTIGSNRIELPEVLRPVNALALRWASYERAARREHTPRHPLETIQRLHDGAILGGYAGVPYDVQMFDDVLNKADPDVRAFVKVWYLHPKEAVVAKAKRLGISKTTIYTRWREVLQYLRGRLAGLVAEIS